MKAPTTRILAFLFMLSMCACAKQPSADKVYGVSADDADMNAAISQARATVQQIITSLQSPRAGQDGFSVKLSITDADRVEHFWLWPVKFDGTNFVGAINNNPEHVTNVKLGQQITVAPTEISDWMFLERGKLVGGYTIRVLRDKMSPTERAAFDREAPFTID